MRKDPNFYERMKDPVKNLFDSLETKTISQLGIMDPSQPIKKICIIFHGAPFTGNFVLEDIRKQHVSNCSID